MVLKKGILLKIHEYHTYGEIKIKNLNNKCLILKDTATNNT